MKFYIIGSVGGFSAVGSQGLNQRVTPKKLKYFSLLFMSKTREGLAIFSCRLKEFGRKQSLFSLKHPSRGGGE